MGNSPYDFVMNVTKRFQKLENKAVHRTFQQKISAVYIEFEKRLY